MLLRRRKKMGNIEKIAKYIKATEFANEKALKKYLKEHPGAKKRNHSVKEKVEKVDKNDKGNDKSKTSPEKNKIHDAAEKYISSKYDKGVTEKERKDLISQTKKAIENGDIKDEKDLQNKIDDIWNSSGEDDMPWDKPKKEKPKVDNGKKELPYKQMLNHVEKHLKEQGLSEKEQDKAYWKIKDYIQSGKVKTKNDIEGFVDDYSHGGDVSGWD
jgi:hypothetical protein